MIKSALTLFVLALFSLRINATDLKSTWYGDPTLSADGLRVAFASGYQEEDGAGIYVVDLKTDSWTLFIYPGRSLRGPVWSHDGNALFVISKRGHQKTERENEVIHLDVTDGKTMQVFSSGMDLEKLAAAGDRNQLLYSQRPYCDLEPSERCGLRSDLYLFNTQNKIHRRLTRIWGGFTRPQFIDERTLIVQIPFYHLPDRYDERGIRCGAKNIDNAIYKISFKKPMNHLETPLTADCSWKPLLRGALGNSYQPVADKTGSRILYISVDQSQPNYMRSIYMSTLNTGQNKIIRKMSSADWDFLDMTADGRFVVNLHNFKSRLPKIWWKDLVNNHEKEISPIIEKVKIVRLNRFN